MKQIILVGVIAVLALILVACSENIETYNAFEDMPSVDSETYEQDTEPIHEPEIVPEPIIVPIGEITTIGNWEIEVTSIVRNGHHENYDGLMLAVHAPLGVPGTECGVCERRHICGDFRNANHITVHFNVTNNGFLPSIFVGGIAIDDGDYVEGDVQINILYNGEHRFSPNQLRPCRMRMLFLQTAELLPERPESRMLVFEIHVERVFNSTNLMLEVSDGTTTILIPIG